MSLALQLAEVVEAVSSDTVPHGEGLCLPSVALLCRALSDAGIDCVAVRGTVNLRPHWWVECDGTRLDPTAEQFGMPLRSVVDDHHPYDASDRFPPGWSDDQVLDEALRAFVHPAAARAYVTRVRRALDAAMSHPDRTLPVVERSTG